MRLKNYLRKTVDQLSNNKNLIKFLHFLNVNTVFLNYHRVLNDNEINKVTRPDDNLVVSKSIFEEQISFIKKNFIPISINEISKNTAYKKNKIVITFDDGYLDNLENALPILKKHECPAIIYITTSFLNNENDAWWVKIWEIILNNNEIIYEKKKINILSLNEKKILYNLLCKKIILMKKKQQFVFFENLKKNNEFKNGYKNKFFLSSANVSSLGKEDLIEIGCHTHYHQNLNILDANEVEEEITTSKKILEKILQRKIEHFSIPFGNSKTYSMNIINTIANHSFKTVVTTDHDIFKEDKVLQIPRIGLGNNDIGDRLNSKLIGFDSLINKFLFR